MGVGIFRFRKILVNTGGCLLPSLFICALGFTDTISLKNGRELKGLVIEKHVDRIVLSTEKGEIPILLSGIKNIQYDEAEQNYYQVGRAYEAENKFGEALAYYEKAIELNPDFEEAKKAALGMRNRFWATSTEGPRNEIEKQQAIFDSWGSGENFEEVAKKRSAEDNRSLKTGLGLALEKKGDWVEAASVDRKKTSWEAGLRKRDRLVSIDGRSLRYLSVDVVRKELLFPRYSNFQLEFERSCFLSKSSPQISVRELGLELALEYRGLVVKSIEPKSAAALAGLNQGDLLVEMDREATRYMPIQKAIRKIETANAGPVMLRVRRSALLTRR